MHKVEFGIYDGAGNCFIRDIWSVDNAKRLRRGWNRYSEVRTLPEDIMGTANTQCWIPLLEKFIERYPDSSTAEEIRDYMDGEVTLRDDKHIDLPSFIFAWVVEDEYQLFIEFAWHEIEGN